MVILISHARCTLWGGACCPHAVVHRNRRIRHIVFDRKTRPREGQTDCRWSITAEPDEDYLILSLCLRLDVNGLNAVDRILKHIRATRWNAAPCPPRNNDTCEF